MKRTRNKGSPSKKESPATVVAGAGRQGIRKASIWVKYEIINLPASSRRKWTVDASLMVEVLA
jgi:hypothetical protein